MQLLRSLHVAGIKKKGLLLIDTSMTNLNPHPSYKLGVQKKQEQN